MHTKEQIEAWYFSHPIIIHNMEIKLKRGMPIFKTERDRIRDIAKFCSDYWLSAWITKKDILREYKDVVDHGYFY